jgi:HEAT repeat protein
MDESTRQKIGRLVAKIDPTSILRLAEQLNSPSLSTKLRALEMAQSMDVADAVFEQLAQLIHDPDVEVRTDAAVVLGTCRRFDALQLLQQAEDDPNLCVREAASRGIEQMAERVAGATGIDASFPGDLF